MTQTPESLRKRKAITVQDLLVKAENEDWHGVADAAMDLREIDATLRVLELLNKPTQAAKPITIPTYSGSDPWVSLTDGS